MNVVRRLLLAPEAITALLLVVALGAGALLSPYFLDASYLLDKTAEIIPIGLLALGLTFVIISGQIDLSVASGTVLTAVLAALAFEAGVPMPWIIPLALMIGMTLGVFNGVLVAGLRLPSLVATLGTLALYRGLAQVLIGERAIRGFPAWFSGIDFERIGIVPIPVLLLLGIAVVAGILLGRSTFGRRVYVLGTNEAAARYSGIRVGRNQLVIFGLSGLFMGMAALLLMSMRPVDYKQLRGGELLAITAVVLGGTSIFGGRGGILGTVLALLLLVAVGSALGVANVRAENRLAVVGVMLIGAVILTNLSDRWLSRGTNKRERT